MNRDLQNPNDPGGGQRNDPMGRPIGDDVITGARPGRSIESGRTDLGDTDVEMGEGTTTGGRPPSM